MAAAMASAMGGAIQAQSGNPPPVVLSLPATATGTPGAVVQVPILAAAADGILGIDLTVRYDPAVIRAQGVTVSGIAEAAGFAVVANVNQAGVIVLSAYATRMALAGSGEIARIQFQVVGSMGASTRLSFLAASSNEGQVPSTVQDGLFAIAAPPAVLSMPDTAQGGTGTTVLVPLSATPADGILAIDMTVQYDPAVLLAQSVAVSGLAATAGFAVVANLNTPGMIVISTYATANALGGSGEILRIGFNVVGSPGTWSTLMLSGVSVNEGAIPATLDPGLFTVNCAGAVAGTPCNDGNPATCGDVCSGGACAGTPVPEPAEVNASVRVAQNGPDATISWDDLPGSFNVYRGSIASGTPFAYNQACLNATGPTLEQSTVDSLAPPMSAGFFYFVTRVDRCRESIPGRDSAGAPVPNPHPCP